MGKLSERLNGSAKTSSTEAIKDDTSKIHGLADAVDSLVTSQSIASEVSDRIKTDRNLEITLESLYKSAQAHFDTVTEGLQGSIESLTELAASGADLPDMSESLMAAVTMLRTFVRQVPAVIARRVGDSVTAIAVDAQLNLAAGVITITDNIR